MTTKTADLAQRREESAKVLRDILERMGIEADKFGSSTGTLTGLETNS